MQYLMTTVDDYDCDYCNQKCMATDYTMMTASICNHDYDYWLYDYPNPDYKASSYQLPNVVTCYYL